MMVLVSPGHLPLQLANDLTADQLPGGLILQLITEASASNAGTDPQEEWGRPQGSC